MNVLQSISEQVYPFQRERNIIPCMNSLNASYGMDKNIKSNKKEIHLIVFYPKIRYGLSLCLSIIVRLKIEIAGALHLFSVK